ncbi:unnamed protein product, partial [Discosporangium mesarthrocarpum]
AGVTGKPLSFPLAYVEGEVVVTGEDAGPDGFCQVYELRVTNAMIQSQACALSQGRAKEVALELHWLLSVDESACLGWKGMVGRNGEGDYPDHRWRVTRWRDSIGKRIAVREGWTSEALDREGRRAGIPEDPHRRVSNGSNSGFSPFRVTCSGWKPGDILGIWMLLSPCSSGVHSPVSRPAKGPDPRVRCKDLCIYLCPDPEHGVVYQEKGCGGSGKEGWFDGKVTAMEKQQVSNQLNSPARNGRTDPTQQWSRGYPYPGAGGSRGQLHCVRHMYVGFGGRLRISWHSRLFHSPPLLKCGMSRLVQGQ